MIRPLAPLFIIAGLLCVAQTTAPATQPTTQPTIKNPDVEALVATIPAELVAEGNDIKKADQKVDAQGRSTMTEQEVQDLQKRITAHGVKVREWGKSYTGKTFTIKAVHIGGHFGHFYVDGHDGFEVQVSISTPKELVAVLEAMPKGEEFTVKGTVPKGGPVFTPHGKGMTLVTISLVNCELVTTSPPDKPNPQ